MPSIGETLATSFEAELRRVAGGAANGVPENGISLDCVYFLAHVLIGDGVAANAKVGDFIPNLRFRRHTDAMYASATQ